MHTDPILTAILDLTSRVSALETKITWILGFLVATMVPVWLKAFEDFFKLKILKKYVETGVKKNES